MGGRSLTEEEMEIYRAVFSINPHISELNSNLMYLLSQKERFYLEINMIREKLTNLEKLVEDFTPNRYGI